MRLSRKSQIALSTLIGALVFAGIEGGIFLYRFYSNASYYGISFNNAIASVLVEQMAAAGLLGGLGGVTIAIFRQRLIFAIIAGFSFGVFLRPMLAIFRAWVIGNYGFGEFFDRYGGVEGFLITYLVTSPITGCFGALSGLASQIFVYRTKKRKLDENAEFSRPPPPLKF